MRRIFFVAGIAVGFLVLAVGLPRSVLAPRAHAAGGETVVGSAYTATSSVWISLLPDVWVRFHSISIPGTTTAVRTVSATMYPTIDLGIPAYAYQLSTSAAVGDVIDVCIGYDTSRFVVPWSSVQIWQIDDGIPTRITREFGPSAVCGPTNHLSTFVAAQNFGVSISIARADSGAALSSVVSPQAPSRSGPPHETSLGFDSAAGDGTLVITNGNIPATGAHLFLNGEIVGTGALFKRNENNLSTPVTVQAGRNTLQVFIDGGPGSSFTLSIQRAL